MCPYDPLTPVECAHIRDFAKARVAGRSSFDADDSTDPLYPETWKDVIGPYPAVLDRIKGDLRKCYNDVSGQDAATVSLRINSTYPSWKHAHKEWAVVYPLSGTGSIGFDENGNAYPVPLKHIFAIPPDFEHAAPAKLAPDELRMTLALSRPEL